MRGGDEEDLPDAGEHENRKRVVDHGFIVNGHELFTDGLCEWIEAGAGAAGEDDPFSRFR